MTRSRPSLSIVRYCVHLYQTKGTEGLIYNPSVPFVDQLPAIKGLGLTEKPFFRLDDARQYLDCALANLQAADGSLNWLDRRIGTLRSEFDMHAQARTNRRLDTLTIFAAIFNPLTLMAGVWGMNFVNMPELNIPYGYPLALGLMAVVGAGMYRFFRRGGWLG